ncbi:CRISPR-associated helicase Cas3' [Kitasatospora sp. NPDC058243]|uniref:CRISPR-associated helicase Cas3' n=1 Tax=Kitasatospora sp. NPDC058243 TaxID=3346397 RepID=UPI0036DF32D3
MNRAHDHDGPDLPRIWAKSPRRSGEPGEALTTHSSKTLEGGAALEQRVGRIPGTSDAFWWAVKLACLLHDAGKVCGGAQRMFGNGPGGARPWGERHEVYSLGFVAALLDGLPREDVLAVAAGVATHHRSITEPGGAKRPSLIALYGLEKDSARFAARFEPVDPGDVRDLLAWYHRTAIAAGLLKPGPVPEGDPGRLAAGAHRLLDGLFEQWEWPEEDTGLGRSAVLLQGAVTLADHLSSAGRFLHRRHPLTAAFRHDLEQRLAQQGFELRPHQIEAGATSGHMLLRAWTGAGKTEAALLWALEQLREMTAADRGIPRVFYTLPYLASINAMVQRLQRDLKAPGRIGVAHSRAASFHLAQALQDSCATAGGGTDTVAEARKAVSRSEATKLFRELLRVGTPYQLLRGALAGPANAGVLVDACNSVFILDELHAYDIRRVGMILAMMTWWEQAGGRIAILSATLPAALEQAVTNALRQPVKPVQPPAGTVFPVRHRIGVRQNDLLADESIEEIKERLRAGEAVLVVANNVKTARTAYRELGPLARELHGPRGALLLHSRFRRSDRNTIEQHIAARYRTGTTPRVGGLLVATQTVEVSLDVDFTSIHTACAPLDALLQRFGRVNRVAAREPADVVVHRPVYQPRESPQGRAFYADGVYEKAPTAAAWDILLRHDGQEIDEAELTGWLDEIYDSPWGQRWREQVEQARAAFTEAFLTFNAPFDDRSALADEFDRQFDGKEAVWVADLVEYERRLTDGDSKAAGRLLAEDLLIPLPGGYRTEYDDRLKVHIAAGPYSPEHGLSE